MDETETTTASETQIETSAPETTVETSTTTAGVSTASSTAGDTQAAEAGTKPYLGEPTDTSKPGDTPAEAKTEAKPDAKSEDPKPASEADYLKTVVKDESVLGTDKALQLDQDLVKAMIPEAQKLGVSPDTMAKLANALAKAQVDAAREQLKDRADYFNRMKEESIKKYNGDFSQINAGIDHWFKPGGVMNNVIRNSELGADPEFLALMHYLGSKRVMDSLAGSADGGGNTPVDPNSTEGLSGLW